MLELRSRYLERHRERPLLRGLVELRRGQLRQQLSVLDRGSQLRDLPDRLLYDVAQLVGLRRPGHVRAGDRNHDSGDVDLSRRVLGLRSGHLVSWRRRAENPVRSGHVG